MPSVAAQQVFIGVEDGEHKGITAHAPGFHEFIRVAEFLLQFFQPGPGGVPAGAAVPGFGHAGVHVKLFTV